MTDSNDDNRKGRSSGRSDRGRTTGDRPFRKPRESGERPERSDGPEGGAERPAARFSSRRSSLEMVHWAISFAPQTAPYPLT